MYGIDICTLTTITLAENEALNIQDANINNHNLLSSSSHPVVIVVRAHLISATPLAVVHILFEKYSQNDQYYCVLVLIRFNSIIRK